MINKMSNTGSYKLSMFIMVTTVKYPLILTKYLLKSECLAKLFSKKKKTPNNKWCQIKKCCNKRVILEAR